MKTKLKKKTYKVTRKNKKQIGRGILKDKFTEAKNRIKRFFSSANQSESTNPGTVVNNPLYHNPMTKNPLYEQTPSPETSSNYASLNRIGQAGTPNEPVYASINEINFPTFSSYTSSQQTPSSGIYESLRPNQRNGVFRSTNPVYSRLARKPDTKEHIYGDNGDTTPVNYESVPPIPSTVRPNPLYTVPSEVITPNSSYEELWPKNTEPVNEIVNSGHLPVAKNHSYSPQKKTFPHYEETNSNNSIYAVPSEITSRDPNIIYIEKLLTENTPENNMYINIQLNIKKTKLYLLNFLQKQLNKSSNIDISNKTNTIEKLNHIRKTKKRDNNNLSNLNETISKIGNNNTFFNIPNKNNYNSRLGKKINRKRKFVIYLLNLWRDLIVINNLTVYLQQILDNSYNLKIPLNKSSENLSGLFNTLSFQLKKITKNITESNSKLFGADKYNLVKLGIVEDIETILKNTKNIYYFLEQYLNIDPTTQINTPPKKSLPKGSLPKIPLTSTISNTPPPLPPKRNQHKAEPYMVVTLPSHPNEPNPTGGYKKTQKRKITKKKNKKTHKK